MSDFYNENPEPKELPPMPKLMDLVLTLALVIKIGLGSYLGWHGVHTHDWTMAGIGVLLLTTRSTHD